MVYETSLASESYGCCALAAQPGRDSNRNWCKLFVLGIDHVKAGIGITVLTTTISLKVEAAMENCSDETGGVRRLLNHNLLKQLCNVIVGVNNGKVEIKKCGLHMEGVTILAFELDPQSALAIVPGSNVEGSVDYRSPCWSADDASCEQD
uniref:Uncharacterized protein n=1 Tax=Peronospora matthiolae TaxID=2874970 RepID=A0AAV1U681_9STRA